MAKRLFVGLLISNLFIGIVVAQPGADSAASAPASSATISSPFETCVEPVFSVQADALYMHRSRPDTTNPALNVFDFGYQQGWQVGAVLRRPCSFDIEARYFQVDGWNDSQLVGGGAVFYENDLRSAELNGRWRVNNWLTALAGFRYVNIHEHVNAAGPTVVDVQNHMFGFQIGGDGLLWQGSRLSVNGVAKAGIYYNDASFDIVGGPPGSLSDRDSMIGFVGEVGLMGKYQATQTLAIRFGYSAMGVSGADVVVDHFAVLGAPAGPVNSNNVFYHGGFLGIEIRW